MQNQEEQLETIVETLEQLELVVLQKALMTRFLGSFWRQRWFRKGLILAIQRTSWWQMSLVQLGLQKLELRLVLWQQQTPAEVGLTRLPVLGPKLLLERWLIQLKLRA